MERTITSQLEMQLNLLIDVVTFGQRVVGKFVIWPIDGATKKTENVKKCFTVDRKTKVKKKIHFRCRWLETNEVPGSNPSSLKCVGLLDDQSRRPF